MSNFKAGAKVVSMLIFACVMSFFVYISIFVMVKEFSTHVVGYQVIDTTANGGKGEVIGEVAEVPEERKENMKYIAQYSEMPKAAEIGMGIFQVICGMGIVFCTAGSVIASVAAKDRNESDFNDVMSDKLRGFKIGAIAAIPSLLACVLAVALKLCAATGIANLYFWIYRWIILCPVKPFFDMMTSNAINFQTASISGISLSAVFSLLLIVFCGVMYCICYNEESVISKLLYKSANKSKEKTRRL